MALRWILVVLVTVGSSSAEKWKTNYKGHKVVRVTPAEYEQTLYLKRLIMNPSYDIDPWSEASRENRTYDLHVPKKSYSAFVDKMTEMNIVYDVIIEDIQNLIDHENDDDSDELTHRSHHHHHRRRRSVDAVVEAPVNGSVVGRYAAYDEIVEWMMEQARSHGNIVQIENIGRSSENRQLYAMKIGRRRQNKPAIWVDAGIHAREWISIATAIYIANKLISGYEKDPSITSMLNEIDWYIMPVVNPDGYQFSRDSNRLWRKTRSRGRNLFWYMRYGCQGVDANRNFNYKWLSHCTSPIFCRSLNPCDETYGGQTPFSEPETRHMSDYILSHQGVLKMYLSLHSYSQMWLIPWGFTADTPLDMEDSLRVANSGLSALRQYRGAAYIAGSPASILYPAGGGSFDWAKAIANVKYSYTLELPDLGTYGFLLPRTEIRPVGEEIYLGIAGAVSAMKADTCWMYGTSCTSDWIQPSQG